MLHRCVTQPPYRLSKNLFFPPERFQNHPTRPFRTFVANKNICFNQPLGDPCVILGSPRRHPWATRASPNPRPNLYQQRVANSYKTQNAMGDPPLRSQLLLNTKHLHPHISALPLKSHLRNGSPAQVMSFATLCLRCVHVLGAVCLLVHSMDLLAESRRLQPDRTKVKDR